MYYRSPLLTFNMEVKLCIFLLYTSWQFQIKILVIVYRSSFILKGVLMSLCYKFRKKNRTWRFLDKGDGYGHYKTLKIVCLLVLKAFVHVKKVISLPFFTMMVLVQRSSITFLFIDDWINSSGHSYFTNLINMKPFG